MCAYRRWWRWWTWYDHQNLRDDRAEAFTSLLWDGVYTYTYTARATTPGTSLRSTAPRRAESMPATPEEFCARAAPANPETKIPMLMTIPTIFRIMKVSLLTRYPAVASRDSGSTRCSGDGRSNYSTNCCGI